MLILGSGNKWINVFVQNALSERYWHKFLHAAVNVRSLDRNCAEVNAEFCLTNCDLQFNHVTYVLRLLNGELLSTRSFAHGGIAIHSFHRANTPASLLVWIFVEYTHNQLTLNVTVRASLHGKYLFARLSADFGAAHRELFVPISLLLPITA